MEVPAMLVLVIGFHDVDGSSVLINTSPPLNMVTNRVEQVYNALIVRSTLHYCTISVGISVWSCDQAAIFNRVANGPVSDLIFVDPLATITISIANMCCS